MPEFMHGNGDNEGQPDCKRGGNIFIDSGKEQYVLRFVDPGGLRLDKQGVTDRDEEHHGYKNRNDDHRCYPGSPIDPEKSAECDEFVEKTDPVCFDGHDRAIEGDAILPEFARVNIVCYACVNSKKKNDEENPVHSLFIVLQVT
jgi:hypothetical protein